jgi:hypothetical protein
MGGVPSPEVLLKAAFCGVGVDAARFCGVPSWSPPTEFPEESCSSELVISDPSRRLGCALLDELLFQEAASEDALGAD